jgi:hypothetical protein
VQVVSNFRGKIEKFGNIFADRSGASRPRALDANITPHNVTERLNDCDTQPDFQYELVMGSHLGCRLLHARSLKFLGTTSMRPIPARQARGAVLRAIR